MSSQLAHSVCHLETVMVLVNDVVYSETLRNRFFVFTATDVVVATNASVYLSMHKVSHTSLQVYQSIYRP